MRDCPRRRVGAAHFAAIDAIVQMEFGILPAAGGMEDQAATFVEAFPLLLGELKHWRDVAQEVAQQRAK